MSIEMEENREGAFSFIPPTRNRKKFFITITVLIVTIYCVCLLSLSAATQYAAHQLNYAVELGTPLFGSLYNPLSYFSWVLQFRDDVEIGHIWITGLWIFLVPSALSFFASIIILSRMSFTNESVEHIIVDETQEKTAQKDEEDEKGSVHYSLDYLRQESDFSQNLTFTEDETETFPFQQEEKSATTTQRTTQDNVEEKIKETAPPLQTNKNVSPTLAEETKPAASQTSTNITQRDTVQQPQTGEKQNSQTVASVKSKEKAKRAKGLFGLKKRETTASPAEEKAAETTSDRKEPVFFIEGQETAAQVESNIAEKGSGIAGLRNLFRRSSKKQGQEDEPLSFDLDNEDSDTSRRKEPTLSHAPNHEDSEDFDASNEPVIDKRESEIIKSRLSNIARNDKTTVKSKRIAQGVFEKPKQAAEAKHAVVVDIKENLANRHNTANQDIEKTAQNTPTKTPEKSKQDVKSASAPPSSISRSYGFPNIADTIDDTKGKEPATPEPAKPISASRTRRKTPASFGIPNIAGLANQETKTAETAAPAQTQESKQRGERKPVQTLGMPNLDKPQTKPKRQTPEATKTAPRTASRPPEKKSEFVAKPIKKSDVSAPAVSTTPATIVTRASKTLPLSSLNPLFKINGVIGAAVFNFEGYMIANRLNRANVQPRTLGTQVTQFVEKMKNHGEQNHFSKFDQCSLEFEDGKINFSIGEKYILMLLIDNAMDLGRIRHRVKREMSELERLSPTDNS